MVKLFIIYSAVSVVSVGAAYYYFYSTYFGG
jgi:hypothetical protein